MHAIECLDLTKTYARRLTALHTIHLQIAQGSSFGLLGENSGWILFDIVFIWFLYALLFLQAGGNISYFYGTAGPGLDCTGAIL